MHSLQLVARLLLVALLLLVVAVILLVALLQFFFGISFVSISASSTSPLLANVSLNILSISCLSDSSSVINKSGPPSFLAQPCGYIVALPLVEESDPGVAPESPRCCRKPLQGQHK